MRIRKPSAAIMLLLFFSSALFGLDDIELSHSIEMANRARSGPPVVLHRSILFTYSQRSYTRYVGIAFDFEDYQSIHSFRRNEHDVFVFLLDPPENLTDLKYRIVVDGLWMPDPHNPNQVRDHKGNLLSRFTFEIPQKMVLQSPVIKPDRTVEFIMRYAEGARVFLTGDFTNWEPFMIEMEEVSPGLYAVARQFPPGSYDYCFVAGGAKVTDPLNPRFGADTYGYLASRFTVQ